MILSFSLSGSNRPHSVPSSHHHPSFPSASPMQDSLQILPYIRGLHLLEQFLAGCTEEIVSFRFEPLDALCASPHHVGILWGGGGEEG